MESTVTTKNMVSIPVAVARRFGIAPGWKLDWLDGDEPDEIRVRVIPDRAERGRRLLGKGRAWAPDRDAVAEFVGEREAEDSERWKIAREIPGHIEL